MYIFDTSALISLFREGRYDMEIFPTLWKNFDYLIKSKKIISVREVRREIEQVDDKLAAWSKDNSELFIQPNDNQTKFVRELFKNSHARGLVKHKQIVSGFPVADPFIIALAFDKNGCVVTEEKARPNAPCIPTICDDHAIEWASLSGFMQKEGWVF